MTSKNGVRYTQERKTEAIKRMVAPNNESVAQIAKEEGITEVTLYKWKKEARTAGVVMPGNGQTSDKWNSQDKEGISNIIKKHRRIDILFNNAGIPGVGEIHEIDENLWNKVVDVNINGVFLVSKYTIPYMIEKKEGSIINMSSCVAEIGLAKRALYAATKGTVLSMTKSMQVDYAKYNIKVNALLPGTIYTPFVDQYLRDSYDDVDEGLRSITKRQLTDQLGKPEDVANAALFLASDDAKFIMGSPLYVDGGVVFGKDT